METSIEGEQFMLSTLDAVESHIRERSQLFTSRLNEFTELVKKVYAGKVGSNLGVDETGNFTGNNLCILASNALGSGIGRLVDFSEIQPWQVSLTLNPLHQIVKLIDMRSKEFLLLDPTYRQINPDFQGGILIIHPDQLDEYYSAEMTKQPVPEIIEVNYSPWVLKNIPPQEVIESINRIVDSIIGNS